MDKSDNSDKCSRYDHLISVLLSGQHFLNIRLPAFTLGVIHFLASLFAFFSAFIATDHAILIIDVVHFSDDFFKTLSVAVVQSLCIFVDLAFVVFAPCA